MKRSVVLLSFMCAVFALCRAQGFREFNTDRDLSSSLINSLYQDRNGMMWIATEDGLNRYDGNKYTIYRNNPGDSTSLCSGYVKAMAEDADGRLYACTRRGIQIYDPATDSFGPRMCNADGTEFTSISNQIVRRNDNEYWSVGNFVKRFSISGPRAFVLEDIDDLSVKLKYIHCAVADNEGNLWLSKSEAGVYRVGKDNEVRKYFGRKDDPSISAMTIGKDGLLYAGTAAHGLLRFDSDADAFAVVSAETDKEVKSLFADLNGEIVMATDGGGIIIYNPATGASRSFRYGNSDIDPLRQKAHCLMRDADGNMWIGIYQSGVVMIPQLPNSFGYMGHRSADTDVIGNRCISSICRDGDGVLWVGADNDGVYGLDGNNECVAHFKGADINVPMCIFEDSRKTLWVGTYLHGVGVLDRKTGRFDRMEMSAGADLPANNCMAMTEDRDHNLWLGMLNSGLMRINLNTGRPDNDFSWRDKIDLWVASLHYSKKTNSLYVGTYSGFQIVTNVSLAEPHVATLIPDDIVYAMDETPDGNVWLGTSNGIVRYTPATGDMKRYNVNDGLHNNTVYAVRHDGRNIWMSLNSGLARFDTETEVFTNFLVDDGLQGNEFYKNSMFRDASGCIYFGGTDGITYFNPRDITGPGRKWTPRITGFYLRGSSASVGVPLYEVSEILLAPDDNSFAIEFGTRELGRPESVLFSYSIDGKPWETLPTGTNIVNFSRLDPGSHSLRVKVTDGITESEIKRISLDVAHPWYATPWAKALYATAVLVMIWWVVRSYIVRMRHKAELLDLTHAEQINEARLQSFVNISHEIRTPMSLVISPLQKLLATDTDPSRRHDYGLILRNAKRILRLIDELMDLRRIEKRQMRLSLAPTELVPLINDLCDTFAQAVTAKNISLKFDFDASDTVACVDAVNFDKILMNLFSNAVKYTPEGGNIDVKLSEDADDVVISVTDTGIGVSDEDKELIFERFYQARGNTAGGTGVGLHLTKQLVLLHGGTIVATDNPCGSGTCFTVRIPKGDVDSARDALNERIPGVQRVHRGTPLSDPKELLLPDPVEMPVDAGKSRSHRVLVVEDDAEIRRYLVAELSGKYRVTAATNGKEALDSIFAKAPDVIVSDIMMPVMDGIELTRIIKGNINLNHIPVMLITAMTRDEDNISALDAGADDFVTKPFNIEVVRSKIAGLIERYRRLKNLYSGSQDQDDKIDKIAVAGSDEKLMSRVMAVLNREMSNTELTVEMLASEVGLSRVHLHRRLKAITNQSPRDFIRNTRLRQAAVLLSEKRLNVAETADLTGFSNAGSFTTSFKKLFGVTPSEYADRNKVSNVND